MASCASILFVVCAIFTCCLREYESARISRIIGGVNAKPGMFPHQVLLNLKVGNRTGFCGGVLICSQFVLTAAHCLALKPDKIVAMLGDVNRTGSFEYRVVRNVTLYMHHKMWNSTTIKYDIGLAKLDSPVKENAYVKPIKMTRKKPFCYYGKLLTLSGFGSMKDQKGPVPKILQYTKIKAISHRECHKIVEYKMNYMRKKIICAKSPSETNITASCFGDSGGPLIYHNRLVGLVSFGVSDDKNNPCVTIYPTVFTYASFYRKWITDTKKYLS